MITEDYVSYEIAKLLKAKGFTEGEDCFGFYDKKGSIHFCQTFGDISDYDEDTCIDAPTLQMAMKWLREVHKIAINIGWGEAFEENYQWWCIILNQNSGKILRESEYHKTYEEACEAAIKYCLENLI